jgi:hypothetical protein
MSENPYAAPSTDSFSLDSGNTPSTSTRRAYLKHEASVKSIGTLYVLGGLVLIFSAVAGIYAAASANDTSSVVGYSIGVLTISILQLWLGFSLRKLKKGARIPAIIVAVIGLIGFPIGTVISAYILYLLCCQKGKMVFSVEYAQVMADTPEIKYRTSTLSWIILILLILFLVAGFFLVSRG